MKNTKSKKNIAGYLEKTWDDHGLRSTFYFNLWGYLCKNFNKRMSIKGLFEQVKDRLYTAQDIFVEDDPDDFISNFGGRDYFLGDWIKVNLPIFLSPSFELPMSKVVESEDPQKEIGPIVYGLFLIYSLPMPNPLKLDKFLILFNNTNKIYECIQAYLFFWDISTRGQRQTASMNFKKQLLSKFRDYIIMKEEAEKKNSNYRKLTANSRAKILAKSFEDMKIPTSPRTIRRKLKKKS